MASRSVISILSSALLVLGLVRVGNAATKDANLVQVNDDNWSQILEGEWMVEL